MYKAEIVTSFKELSARDKVKFKTSNDFQSLDTVLDDSQGSITINVENVIALRVQNDNAENKEYTKYIVVDTNGDKFSTGSEAFYNTLSMICDEMSSIGETEFQLRVFKKPSKNYAGRGFITCELV